MALLEPARSKKSRYQVNISAGNSPYHLPAKTVGTNFLCQRGAEPGTRPQNYIAKNTNDTLTTVTISITPSNLCQHYFLSTAALMPQSLICWILQAWRAAFAVPGSRLPRPDLTGLISIT